MFSLITLLKVFIALNIGSPAETDTDIQPSILETESQYLIFDIESTEVLTIPNNRASVDSLLNLSSSLADTDSRGSYETARQAYIISRNIDYKDGMARAHNFLGIRYFNFGEYEMAINHYLAALDIEEELGNDDRIASLLNNFSLVYAEQENYDRATFYLSESLEKRRSIGQTSQVHVSTNNLGVMYRRQGQYDKALEYLFQAAEGSLEEEPDSSLHMVAILNIGNTYRNKGDVENSLHYLNKASEYFERHNHQLDQLYAKLFLAYLYRDKGEIYTALEYIRTTIELAEAELHRERLKEAHLLAAELYELQGEFENAYSHFRVYHQISDTLNNNERQRRINELQIRYEVEQKDQEIELLNRESALREAQLSKQQIVRNFLAVAVIFLGVFTAFLIYANRIRKRNNRALKESRIEIENQNQKLSTLNKEKDEFLSLAVHDLRSPLSSVMMIADVMKTDGETSKSELEEYTSIIHVSTQRMLNLVNDLLDIQSENKQVANEVINPIDVLNVSMKNFEKSAQRKNIELKNEIKKDQVWVRGNSNYLMRIFDNLLSNSIKYSPSNTTVTISAEKTDGVARITFKDEGPGISYDEQKNLFRQFGTTSNKPTGNETSVGLGLYIVKKFTKAMNGNVYCESEPDKGSSFILEIPTVEVPEDKSAVNSD
jgi:signal transduction histidine kinase